MARPIQPSTPQSRKLADAWLRRSTRAIVLGATGLAAAIGVVVAQEHPGAGSTSSGGQTTGSGSSAGTGSSTSGSSSSNSSGSSDSGSSGSSDNTGATGNTGNSGAATGPSISRSAPAVTSGGSSR